MMTPTVVNVVNVPDVVVVVPVDDVVCHLVNVNARTVVRIEEEGANFVKW
jgi:hypothetical protein